MVVTVDPESTKKRKKDEMDTAKIVNITDESVQEGSPRKSRKMVLPHGEDSLPDVGSQDSVSEDSQDESEQDSGSEHCQEENESSLKIVSLCSGSQIQEQGVLELKKNDVFKTLLIAFSQDRLPDRILYDNQSYNLTAAYNEFWNTFYFSPPYSEGYNVKIPKVQKLTTSELKSMVKILRRGWEDERYLPKTLARPFLESCLYKNLDMKTIKQETFFQFIEPSDELMIKDKKIVDQNIIDVFKKYCSASAISIGDDVQSSCINAANEIMVLNMKPVIEIWSEELRDIMPMSTFNFLMNHNRKSHSNSSWEDMEDFSAPHELWQSFFLGWSDEQVKYYFHALDNGRYGSQCNLCGYVPFNAKHFLCVCDALLDTLRLTRHDAVLKKILVQLDLAMKKKVPYFSKSNVWNVLTYNKNEHYEWPEELSILKVYNKYPHIVVYSVSPNKKALVIEHSISWEHWIDVQKQSKTEDYMIVKKLLEQVGFEVEYRVIVFGSRGVLIPDIYDLFHDIFGMKHSEISKAHEEISQEILNIPYLSKYYKDLKIKMF